MPCAAHAQTHYYALTDGRQSVGEVSWKQVKTPTGVETREQLRVQMRNRGGTSALLLTSVIREAKNSAAIDWRQTRTIGEERDVGVLTVSALGHGQWRDAGGERAVEVPSDALFPSSLATLVSSLPPGESRAFQLWEPGLQRWQQAGATRLPDGSLQWLINGQPSDAVWDDAGRRLLRPIKLMGSLLQLQPCGTSPCASADAALDAFASRTLASPYRLSASALNGKIRYLIDGPADQLHSLPATSGQTLRWNQSLRVVDICRHCSPDRQPPADLQSWKGPTRWLQSDAWEVRALVRQARAASGSAELRMRRLELQVRKHMSGPVDYFHYLSARQAAAQRSGDCTEMALLLAAAGRAAGVPTRVVAGLAYASRFTGRKHVFSPHMWVQAWVGDRWENYDAGLGSFGAGHLALAVGDGDPTLYAGVYAQVAQLRIVKAAQLVD